MDILSAIAQSNANRNQELKVFDWDKAAQIIKKEKLYTVYAGLTEDWDYTGGCILINGIIPKHNTAYLSSTWATPVISVDNGIFVECYKMASEVPNWNDETYWPESARRILDPFLLTQLY